MDSPRFGKFDISKTSYKKVNGQDIDTYVLVPKNASKGKHPVCVHFHGGFLVLGAALYPEWISQWTMDYLHSQNSILIAPNHRLLPESTGADILSDISDFWTWLSHSLGPYLSQTAPGITADLSHTLIYGVSAGGYLAVQSALSQVQHQRQVKSHSQESPQGQYHNLNPDNQLTIRAIIASYPMLDLRATYYVTLFAKPVFGFPTLAADILDRHLATVSPGTIVTSADPPLRTELAVSMVQQGRYMEFLGESWELYPFDRLGRMAQEEDRGEGGKAEMPYMFILHGEKDSAVPAEGSRRYVELSDQVWGPGRVELHVQEGADHGFDGTLGLEVPWLREGLEGVSSAWLGTAGDE